MWNRWNTLCNNPVEWSRKAVGTRLRLALCCGLHVGIGLVTVGAASTAARWLVLAPTMEVPKALTVAIQAFFCWVVAIGAIFMPTMYLIALRGVLRELDRRSHGNGS
jgi:hypothetical protein